MTKTPNAVHEANIAGMQTPHATYAAPHRPRQQARLGSGDSRVETG